MSSERRGRASCVGQLLRSFARAIGSMLICGSTSSRTRSPGCTPTTRKHSSTHSSHSSLASSVSSSTSSLEEELFIAARKQGQPNQHQDRQHDEDQYGSGGELYEPNLRNHRTMENKVKVTEKELSYLKHKIQKLLVKLEEEDETETRSSSDDECVVCINAKATMQTYPCGHRVVCRKCFVKTIQMVVSQRRLPLRCVVCRAKVLRLKQTNTGGFPLGYIRSNSKQMERATLLAALSPSTSIATAVPTASTPSSPLSEVFQAQRVLVELFADPICIANADPYGTSTSSSSDEGGGSVEAKVEVPLSLMESKPEPPTKMSHQELGQNNHGATRPTSWLVSDGEQQVPVLLSCHSSGPDDSPSAVQLASQLATPPHDWYSLYSRRATHQLARLQQTELDGPCVLAQQVQLATPISATFVEAFDTSKHQVEEQLEQEWLCQSSSSFRVGSLLPLLPIEEEESLESEEGSPVPCLPYQSICSSSSQHTESSASFHNKLHKSRSESSLGGYLPLEDTSSHRSKCSKYQSVTRKKDLKSPSDKNESGLRFKASSFTSLIHGSLSRMFHSRTFTALNTFK